MEIFTLFYAFLHEFFAVLTIFWRIFVKNTWVVGVHIVHWYPCWCLVLVLLLVSFYYWISGIFRTKMGNFYSFLRLSSRIFHHSDDILANFRENSWVVGVHIVLLASILCCWHPYFAVGIPADASTVVGWSLLFLASLLLQVSLLLLTLWCSYSLYCLCCCWPPSMLLIHCFC